MVGVAPERSLAIENRKLSSWQFVGSWVACGKGQAYVNQVNKAY